MLHFRVMLFEIYICLATPPMAFDVTPLIVTDLLFTTQFIYVYNM